MTRGLDAVLFDWGDTLTQYAFDDDYARRRTAAGLAALGRPGLPEPSAISAWFDALGPEFYGRDSEDEVDFIGILSSCFSELSCSLTDDDVRLYARESLWEREMTVPPEVLAVLDELRDGPLKIGIVSNTALPEWLLAPEFQRQGLTERVDTIVLSSEVGKRKPHPAIFERALSEVGVSPERTLFVGDRRYQDVLGASRAGMRTVLARWFRDDVNPDGGEPDFEARSPADVLAIVERLDSAG